MRRRFNKKQTLRILSGVLTVTLMISIASLAVVYFTLPSVREMLSDFVPVQLQTLNVRPPAPVQEVNEAETTSGSTSPSFPAAPTTKSVTTPTSGMLSYLLTRFGGTSTDIRTCSLLNRPIAQPQNALEWKSAFDRFASGTNAEDPLLESMLLPAGYFVRIPAVRQVLETMRDALETGDHRFLDQPTFPPALSQASAQTIRFQEPLSRLSARAYHLATLTRAVQMNPDLGNDTRTANLCTLITAAAQNDMNGRPGLSIDDEKQALLSYLAAVGFSPTQLNFDPNLGSQISVVMTERQVSLSTPWLTRAMGAPFYVVALRVLLPSTTP